MSGWLKGVLVAWQVGLFGSLGCLLGAWLGGARCVMCAPCGVQCCMLSCPLLCHVCGYHVITAIPREGGGG